MMDIQELEFARDTALQNFLYELTELRHAQKLNASARLMDERQQRTADCAAIFTALKLTEPTP
jgi:hypothetical protein